jgi:hypothetical protein
VTLPNCSQSFGVVCHDAGGANQIIAMLSSWEHVPTYVCMEGPAAALWQQTFPDFPLSSDFSWVNTVSVLISGTGWASDLEHEARRAARDAGVYSLAVLDHWTSYNDRFIRSGETILPNEIWVLDFEAEQLALQCFPNTKIIRKPDFYGESQASLVQPVTNKTPNHLLYLLEPIRSGWGREIPGEFQALQFFLDNIRKLAIPKETVISLRPHPSESEAKYFPFCIEQAEYPVRLACCSLTEGLSASRWVAGCQTFAMTIALRAGRRVYGTLPPWAPRCSLPHGGIVHLRDVLV